MIINSITHEIQFINIKSISLKVGFNKFNSCEH